MKKLIVITAVLLLGIGSSSPQQSFTSAPQEPILLRHSVVVIRVSDAYGKVVATQEVLAKGDCP